MPDMTSRPPPAPAPATSARVTVRLSLAQCLKIFPASLAFNSFSTSHNSFWQFWDHFFHIFSLTDFAQVHWFESGCLFPLPVSLYLFSAQTSYWLLLWAINHPFDKPGPAFSALPSNIVPHLLGSGLKVSKLFNGRILFKWWQLCFMNGWWMAPCVQYYTTINKILINLRPELRYHQAGCRHINIIIYTFFTQSTSSTFSFCFLRFYLISMIVS